MDMQSGTRWMCTAAHGNTAVFSPTNVDDLDEAPSAIILAFPNQKLVNGYAVGRTYDFALPNIVQQTTR